MIVTEKDSEKHSICYVCDKMLLVGQSYENITTHSKTKIVVHSDCISGKGEK